MFLVSQNPY